MKTASYFTYRGPGRVGISIGTPRGLAKGLRFYRALAPRREWLQLPEPEYRARYFGEILAPLEPQRVVRELHRLTDGVEPVLLCFERPPFTADNWCHRRMVAEWLHDYLDLDVPEIEDAPRQPRLFR